MLTQFEFDSVPRTIGYTPEVRLKGCTLWLSILSCACKE